MLKLKISELITKLQAWENQDAEIAVEAPFYFSGSDQPYRWPLTDYAIEVVDVEDENDSDGDSCILKTCFENDVVPNHLNRIEKPDSNNTNDVIEAVDSLADKLLVLDRQSSSVCVRLTDGSLVEVMGIEEKHTDDYTVLIGR